MDFFSMLLERAMNPSDDTGLTKLETLIDESGVLEDTGGSASEKVAQLIDECKNYQSWVDGVTYIWFRGNVGITDLYIPYCKNLKTIAYLCCDNKQVVSVKFEDTSQIEGTMQAFLNCGVKSIETLDCSSMTFNRTFDNCFFLTRIKVVPETIKSSVAFAQSTIISLESAKNILLGLYNYSGTDKEFIYSITFSTPTLEILEADGNTAPNGLTWAEYVMSIGWNM